MLERECDIQTSVAKECLEMIKANGRFAGLFREINGTTYVDLSSAASQSPTTSTSIDTVPEQPSAGIPAKEPQAFNRISPEAKIEGEQSPIAMRPIHEAEGISRVFIGHGRNPRILEQIKAILNFGKFEPVVAEDEETTAIPVPEKVMEAMHKCHAAIMNISAEAPVITEHGEEHFEINDNVLIEIGAAFVLYRKNVILVVDDRVDLPSNLQGLYECRYQGDSLDFDSAMKIQQALIKFREKGKHNPSPAVARRSGARRRPEPRTRDRSNCWYAAHNRSVVKAKGGIGRVSARGTRPPRHEETMATTYPEWGWCQVMAPRQV